MDWFHGDMDNTPDHTTSFAVCTRGSEVTDLVSQRDGDTGYLLLFIVIEFIFTIGCSILLQVSLNNLYIIFQTQEA